MVVLDAFRLNEKDESLETTLDNKILPPVPKLAKIKEPNRQGIWNELPSPKIQNTSIDKITSEHRGWAQEQSLNNNTISLENVTLQTHSFVSGIARKRPLRDSKAGEQASSTP